MKKTSFITPWGTYYYAMMPFGLKHVRATYQRTATILLHELMHKEVEVYIDDMIIKSKERVGHVPTMIKFFMRLKKYIICLKPQKCAFEVTLVSC